MDAAPLDQLGADLLQVRIPVGSRLHGVYLRELRLPRGATVSLVVRGEEAFTPNVETRLREHDQLLVVTPARVRAGHRGAAAGRRPARQAGPLERRRRPGAGHRAGALAAGCTGPAGMMVG